jgi:hypothetical protein
MTVLRKIRANRVRNASSRVLSNIASNRRLSVLIVRGVTSPNECSADTGIGICSRLITAIRVRTNLIIGVGLYS